MAHRRFHRTIIPRHVQKRVKNSLLYLFLFLVLIISVIGMYRGGVHLVGLKSEQITARELPYALMLSLMRMSFSFAASLVVAFLLGFPAARTTWGERTIIPLLDILQSVPVVGFFPAAITFFIGVTNGNRLGVEMAAIFLIFTSQAWSLSFAVYESIKSIPGDQADAVASLGLQGSQSFWRLYAPACAPRLVYSSILAWSNGWFFLVACEIITVGPTSFHLPGIGSFLARAAEQDQTYLVFWGLGALGILIVAMDLLFWRPTADWAQRFRYETGQGSQNVGEHISIPQVVLSQATPLFAPASRMFRALFYPLLWLFREVALPLIWDLPAALISALWRIIYVDLLLKFLQGWQRVATRARWLQTAVTWTVLLAIVFWGFFFLYRWFEPPWPAIMREIPLAILASTLRLIVALTVSLLWVLPLVLWTWNKPALRRWLTTVAQVGASLPAVALFPLFIILVIKKFGGGMGVASTLLLIASMQWYPLFNCLAGAAAIPSDLIDATHSMGLGSLRIWRRLVYPAVRPALITGCITACGSGWNALVVTEYVSYKGHILSVNGIGALLSRAVYQLGDSRSITFCIAGMVGWIVLLNLTFWQPIYRSSIERFKFDA